MYFDSRIKGKKEMPWFYTRSEWEEQSDMYFKSLEYLAEEVDDIESETPFITDLTPDDFGNGYQFVLGRIKELREYLKADCSLKNKAELLKSLARINEKLEDFYNDSFLYDDNFDDDDEDDIDEADLDDKLDSWGIDEDDDFDDNKDDYEW